MSTQYPAGSPQAMRVVLERVIEAIGDINACMPANSGVQDATAGLINSCTDFNTAVSVLSLQLETAICWLSNGGVAENCNWPSDCPFFTVTSLDPCPGMNIYDSRARGFLLANLVSTNGGVMFTPSTDPEALFPMSFLETVEFAMVETIVGDLVCSFHPVILSVRAPTLVTLGRDLIVSSNPSLETLEVTALATIGRDLQLDGNFAVAYDFPALTSIGRNVFISNVELLTLSFPSLLHIVGDVQLSGGDIVSFSMPNLATFTGVSFTAANCNLDVTTVNDILVKLDTIGVTGATIDLSGGTNAAPTGAGITAAANLVGAGNTVLTN